MKSMLIIVVLFFHSVTVSSQTGTGGEDRQYWIKTMTRIADPVLTNLSENKLKERMPFET